MSSTSFDAGPQTRDAKVSLLELPRMKQRGEKIAAVTAYDAPSGRLADIAGVDCVLVGDSAAMTLFGSTTTVTATMDEMLLLTRAVVRGVRRALIIADMPFGSYQVTDEEAVENAIRFVKEAGADAVKLEGGGTSVRRADAIVAAGIPVVGHLGLTPQSAGMLGGFKIQGRTGDRAHRLYKDALALERSGCGAIVLEAVPAIVAREITDSLRIPTIGIGAGASCDGQILVWHDMLGLTDGHLPQFVKRYADLREEIRSALVTYVAEVRASEFPEPRHTYTMPALERERFESLQAHLKQTPVRLTD